MATQPTPEQVTRALYDALNVFVRTADIRAALLGPIPPLASLYDQLPFLQAEQAIAAYDTVYPEGLLPGVADSDVLP